VLRARFGESFEVVAVDRTGGPGLVRANLAVELPVVGDRFDLVVAAHLLNELFVDREPAERVALRARRVRAWSTLLAPNGVLILIEPALRDTSRELLAVRDQVLATGSLHVLAPCFWTGPCPALALDRDWCHDAAPVTSKPRVDFSYLVLRAEAVPPAPTVNRVVSDPMPEKGRLRLFVCGPQGRHPLIRLTRYRAPQNAALDRATRGAALSITGTEPAADGLRVTPASTVTTPARDPGKP
jgi:ribosomal protein RSM22 (predicted rRNA methylase)